MKVKANQFDGWYYRCSKSRACDEWSLCRDYFVNAKSDPGKKWIRTKTGETETRELMAVFLPQRKRTVRINVTQRTAIMWRRWAAIRNYSGPREEPRAKEEVERAPHQQHEKCGCCTINVQLKYVRTSDHDAGKVRKFREALWVHWVHSS